MKEVYNITSEGEEKIEFFTEEGNFEGFVVGEGPKRRGVFIDNHFLPGYLFLEGVVVAKEGLDLLIKEMEAQGAVGLGMDSATVQRWPEHKWSKELACRWIWLGIMNEDW